MLNKKKQFHKSKEQLLWEAEEKKQGEIRKKFIDETFMPIMEEVTTSLEDAQIVSDSLKTVITQTFQQKSKEMKLGELYLRDKLLKNKPEMTDRFTRLVGALEDQTVDDALRILQGLFDEINRVIWAQFKSKKLTDFKAND